MRRSCRPGGEARRCRAERSKAKFSLAFAARVTSN
jgi:hypothetical protein